MKQLVLAGLLTMGLAACSGFTDPAVRLAYCMKRVAPKVAEARGPIEEDCKLKTGGPYVVLMHPAGDLSDAEPEAAGLPWHVIKWLRIFRKGAAEAIYVFEEGGLPYSSRTTYQSRFVSIKAPLVCSKLSGGKLAVVLEGEASKPVVIGCR